MKYIFISIVFLATLSLQAPVVEAKSVTWTNDDIETLYFHGNRFHNFATSITYKANVYLVQPGDDELLSDGDTVAVGDTLRFVPTAHRYSDIAWFGTGWMEDSPYGEWVAGAGISNPPAGRDNLCVSRYEIPLTHGGVLLHMKFFVPLSVRPPAKRIDHSGTAGLHCVNAGTVCEVTSAGTIRSNFVFGETYGKFHFAFKSSSSWENGNGNIMDSGGLCDYGGVLRTAESGQTYTLSVPIQTISFSFTAVQPNRQPTNPTITGNGGTTGASLPFSFRSTDPDNDRVRYYIDWDNNGQHDDVEPNNDEANGPPVGYLNSGTTWTQNHTWNSEGLKTFKVRTRDSHGSYSGWSTKTITIRDLDGRCGVSHGGLFAAQPNAGFCSVGTRSAITFSNNQWRWTCQGTGDEGTDASCSATKNNVPNAPTVTGADRAISVAAPVTFRASDPDGDRIKYQVDWDNNGTGDQWVPASGFVNSNTLSSINKSWNTAGAKTFKVRTRDEHGLNSGWTTKTITVTQAPVNGSCGFADGLEFSSRPNLTNIQKCFLGTPSALAGTGPWTWSCAGANGGTNASCSARKNNVPNAPTVTGVDRAINVALPITFRASDPDGDRINYLVDWDNNGTGDQWVPANGLVNSNTLSSINKSWNRVGAKTFKVRTEDDFGNESTWTTKTINVTPGPVNGSCGVSNGRIFASAPNAGLCLVGAPSALAGTGPWTWSCAGTNGGTNASCSATKNNAPNAPTITGADRAINVAAPVTFQASDPDNNRIKYQVDWDNNGTGDQWVPANGQVNSNTLSSINKSWNTVGAKTFKVRTRDEHGLNSGWTTKTITVTEAQAGAPINGACGTANGSEYAAQPNLTNPEKCTTGAPSALAGNGPWTWSCAGANGGANANCSARLAIAAQNNTITATNCTISTGNDSCTTNVTWNSVAFVAPKVRMGNDEISTNPSSLGQPEDLSYNGGNVVEFKLFDGNVEKASTQARATCTAGTEWDGTACETPTVSFEVCDQDGTNCAGTKDALTNTPLQLKWTSNGDRCTGIAGPGFTTNNQPQGTDAVTSNQNPNESDVFNILCQFNGAPGAIGTLRTVTVNAQSSEPDVSANPRVVESGGETVLTWDLKGQTGCSLVGGSLNLQGLNTNGSQGDIQIFGRTTFTLTCGGQTDSVVVEVVPQGYET